MRRRRSFPEHRVSQEQDCGQSDNAEAVVGSNLRVENELERKSEYQFLVCGS
jgi:hypothetical protein